MKTVLPALIISLLLALPVSAQTESACTADGLPVLADANGDVDFQFLPAGGPLDMYDLESLHVGQQTSDTGENEIVFTLKVASLAQTLPRQAWFATFISGDTRARGVRMVADEQGGISFQHYVVLVDTDGNITEGRYPETGSPKPAAESSSFSEDGTIRIVVPAQELGFRRGDGTLSGFNAGSLQQIPTGDTLTPSGDLLALIADGMPDDMSRSGEVLIVESCADAPKAAANRFGGSLGAGLLMLLALAGLRRR